MYRTEGKPALLKSVFPLLWPCGSVYLDINHMTCDGWLNERILVLPPHYYSLTKDNFCFTDFSMHWITCIFTAAGFNSAIQG